MSLPLEQAYKYCREVTRRRAKNFYYAFVALPREQRRGICAAYAFCRQCDDYSDEGRPLEERARLLREYRVQLAQAYDEAPEGPVFTALMDTAQRFTIPQEYFDEVISGVEMDLKVNSYQTFEELYQYCYRVASVVGLISIEIFGYRDPRARQYAIDLGIAMQLTNILRDLKEDSHRDRIYLPLDELARFDYPEESLRRGVLNEPFTELMRFQVARARRYFVMGRRLLPLLPLRSRFCPAVLQGLYLELLRRIEARGYDVFNGRIMLTTPEKVRLTGKIWLQTLLGSLPALRSS
ncbi:MAG: phytoene/squalene synthase family protein [Dehalococcoidia bacterium]